MNEYVKNFLIRPEADKKAVKKIKEELDNIAKSAKEKLEDALTLAGTGLTQKETKAFHTQLSALEQIENIKRKISEYEKVNSEESEIYTENLKSQLKTLEQFANVKIEDTYEYQQNVLRNRERASQLEQFRANSLSWQFKEGLGVTSSMKGTDVANALGRGLNSVLTKALSSLKKILSDAWEEFGEIVDSSLLTNSSTRDAMFSYGFNTQLAQAFNKTLELMGLSEDDMMYMNSEQAKLFQKTMTTLSEKYTQLYDSGFYDDYYEFQLEWKLFKEEFLLELVQFFINNKDTIKAAFEAILAIAGAVLDLTSFLNKSIYASTDNSALAASSSEYVNSVTNSKTTNNVKIDNSYTGVSANDRSAIESIAQSSYEQIVNALNIGG